MSNRIREIRKHYNLSQEKFGAKLGVTKTAVSKMELGTYNVTDTMIKLICSEFSISEDWIRYKKGNMLVENNSSILGELTAKYNLDNLDRSIIESFLNLSSEDRLVIKSYISSIKK